ncbi:MAG: hypothetical protein AAGC65_07085 [Mucilaginibacter sp.]|uniref:hypothetical protein n=1 Tax=Mucilaginibacter sp. TaxID=1882438 RepID=UPI0031A3C696
MKLLCLLLSLFVVLLSARPCCADNDCRVNASAVKKDQVSKNTSPEKTCPGCSPFFSCGSCAGFVVTKRVTHNLKLIAEHRVVTYAPYQQPNLKEVAQAIWQPPQLS